MEQESVNQRLNLIVDTFEKGKKAAFARKAGMSPQGAQEILAGRKGDPSFKVLVKILESYPSIDANWLVLGQGSMYREVPDAITLPETPPISLSPQQMEEAFKQIVIDKLGLNEALEREFAESSARSNNIASLDLKILDIRIDIDNVSSQITLIRNGEGDESQLPDLKARYLDLRNELNGKYQLLSVLKQQDKSDIQAARALSEHFAQAVIRGKDQ